MTYLEAQQLILNECQMALNKIPQEKVDNFINILLSADKVFLIGVGRVKLSLSAFAKRLVHLGINANIVGDINEPAMTDKDVLIVGSGSGESLIPVAIAKKAKSIGGTIVHIGSNPQSSLSPITDLMIRIPVQTKLYLEDEITSAQPMSSLFEQTLLLFCDSVAMIIVNRKNLDLGQLWQFHANLE